MTKSDRNDILRATDSADRAAPRSPQLPTLSLRRAAPVVSLALAAAMGWSVAPKMLADHGEAHEMHASQAPRAPQASTGGAPDAKVATTATPVPPAPAALYPVAAPPANTPVMVTVAPPDSAADTGGGAGGSPSGSTDSQGRLSQTQALRESPSPAIKARDAAPVAMQHPELHVASPNAPPHPEMQTAKPLALSPQPAPRVGEPPQARPVAPPQPRFAQGPIVIYRMPSYMYRPPMMMGRSFGFGGFGFHGGFGGGFHGRR
jgi:hypothetical protein